MANPAHCPQCRIPMCYGQKESVAQNMGFFCTCLFLGQNLENGDPVAETS